MKVQKYLKEHGVAKLQEEFSIKVKEYPEGLLVLNYDQISSPKSHEITVECRALILDTDFNVVSRSFDRFFNLGEVPESQTFIDMSKAVCFDKVDGSLIRLYYWNNKWNIATRGMAFAEGTPNGFSTTFAELVLKALGFTENEFQLKANELLREDLSYICEVTSTENRCVKSYTGYTLHYLAARNNKTFEYVNESGNAKELGMVLPKVYTFGSTQECIQASKGLKNLDEGYVLYQDGIPICKIKSPAYCAVHLLRGEGLNPKRISELVLTGEQEEYLVYFPEDRDFVQPYVQMLQSILVELDLAYSLHKGTLVQKDFALAVKNVKGSGVLFSARKNKSTVQEAW
jgi:hypothetical protein